jgi:protein-disulfide isomerase
MKNGIRFPGAALAPLLVVLMGVAPLAAQQAEGITRQQADEILNELRQIRQLLQQQNAKGAPAPAPEPPPPQRATVKVDGVPMLGVKTAPITIVEFTDYQCPFCQRFHLTTFNEIKKNYIDTGKVRFFSRDMPLDFHPNAMRAAQAARCAQEQGKYWQLRDVMGANPNNLDLESILKFASVDVKMDAAALKTCIESEKYKAAVQTDTVEAMKIGAQGTPTFIVGKSTPDGVDGEVMMGALPYPMFDEKLKALSK